MALYFTFTHNHVKITFEGIYAIISSGLIIIILWDSSEDFCYKSLKE